MTNNGELPRVLIIGTLPYNPNESSRALDSYFHNWPNSKLRMIYSNSNQPYNCFCESHFRITDIELLRKLFNKNKKIGTIFDSRNIAQNANDEISIDSKKISKFKKKSTFRYYARKTLWNNKRWWSIELENWIEQFNPQIVYICFSDDYFILDISYFISAKYNIPIIAQIGDDYFFKKYNFLMTPYIKKYKELFSKVMETDGFGLYISDKISDKYNASFLKKGFPFYLSSEIKEHSKPIIYEFNYFGKINLGRDNSLCLLGDALKAINKNYYISIYTGTISKKELRKLKKHNCIYKGSVGYDNVKEIMNSGTFNIIASGFSKQNLEDSRYSLSTKVADSLISAGPIIAIGPDGDGAIDYLKERNCAIILNNQNIDVDDLAKALLDSQYLANISKTATNVYNKEHNIENNRQYFEQECIKLTKKKQ